MSRLFASLVLMGALAACGSEPQDVKSHHAKKAADDQKPTQVQPLDSGSSSYEYTYSPVGKRDPFRSTLEDLAERPADASMRPDCGPLCGWDIGQLKLVAVISGISNPVAMLEAPNNKGYIVRRGTFVGKRNGKVTQIRSGEVVITEIFKDQMGKPHVSPIVVRLPADTKDAFEPEEQNLLGAEVAE